MRFLNSQTLLAPVIGALTLAFTAGTAQADRKVKVYRDLDGDGHFNKKTYKIPSHRGHYGHRGFYGHRPSYYGYGYRPYDYGYGYGYRSYGPSFGVSIHSRPTYTSRIYRGHDASNSLASEVQSELRKRGFYRGAVDGAIGPASRSAIRSYQRSKGLAATGRIDSSLLRSLRIN